MPYRDAIKDREWDKFVEFPTGETAVRTYVANDSDNAIPVDAAFSYAAPTGPFKITVFTADDTAQNPLVAAFTNRVSVSIRNRSQTTTVYFGNGPGVTPDDTATGGWEIGPNEDFNLDLDESNSFYLICPSGETAIVKILEIASEGASGGGGGGPALTAIQEQLAGVVDGVNTVFTITQVPDSDGAFVLYLNGIYQRPITDYNRIGQTVTMVVAPVAGQALDAVYEF